MHDGVIATVSSHPWRISGPISSVALGYTVPSAPKGLASDATITQSIGINVKLLAYILCPALQRECVPRLLVMVDGMLHLVPPAAHVPTDDAHPQVLGRAAVVAHGVGRLLLHVPADLGADIMQFQGKQNDS